MDCPTCCHEMQAIEGILVQWCPRCGTILFRSRFRDDEAIEPILVSECRKLIPKATRDFWWRLCLHLGIEKSIIRPGEQKES